MARPSKMRTSSWSSCSRSLTMTSIEYSQNLTDITLSRCQIFNSLQTMYSKSMAQKPRIFWWKLTCYPNNRLFKICSWQISEALWCVKDAKNRKLSQNNLTWFPFICKAAKRPPLKNICRRKCRASRFSELSIQVSFATSAGNRPRSAKDRRLSRLVQSWFSVLKEWRIRTRSRSTSISHLRLICDSLWEVAK